MRSFSIAASALLLATRLAAQGSALDYLDDASLRRASGPRDQAAAHASRGDRLLAKAEKLEREAEAAAGDPKLAAKAGKAFEQALAAYAAALRKDPSFREGHLKVGRCYLELGQLEKAIGACSQAWGLDPSRPDAPLCEPRAHLGLNRPRRAQEIFLLLKERGFAEAETLLSELDCWAAEHPDNSAAQEVARWIAQQRAS
jgi:tetratricopeptide (TPR) repeat protein